MTSKEDPVGMTPLREAAISAHEMYKAFREGGFSRSESLELVAKIVTNMLVAAANDETPKDESSG